MSRDVLSRPAPPPDLVLRYGDRPEHVIDLRLPAAQTGPLVVFLHGGFWRAEYDRAHTGPLAADLAARGHPVATPEYRRMGHDGGGWPGTFDDVAAALAAVPRLVAPYCDPGGYVLAGHSAGGQLALLNAAAGAGRVLALAPVADLGLACALDLDDGVVRDLLGGDPETAADRYDRVDPARRGPVTVPTRIIHGDADVQVPVELSRRFVAACGGDLVELAGVDHFAVIDPLSAAWPQVVAAIDR